MRRPGVLDWYAPPRWIRFNKVLPTQCGVGIFHYLSTKAYKYCYYGVGKMSSSIVLCNYNYYHIILCAENWSHLFWIQFQTDLDEISAVPLLVTCLDHPMSSPFYSCVSTLDSQNTIYPIDKTRAVFHTLETGDLQSSKTRTVTYCSANPGTRDAATLSSFCFVASSLGFELLIEYCKRRQVQHWPNKRLIEIDVFPWKRGVPCLLDPGQNIPGST